jgi:anti-anti-sigma factor
MPVIVQLPGEIDVTNAGDALELITAACAPGVTLVIADLTATRFCDCAGLRHLLQASQRAAAAGAEVRLVIAPGGAVSRVIELTDAGRYLTVYLSYRPVGDGSGPP